MRIRIQTYNPLPDVKAWFVPDEHTIPETVSALKAELCRRVPALRAGQHHAGQLILLLDDFELLDDCPFGAVRDGDLICIKKRPAPSVDEQAMVVDAANVQGITRGHKRKRSSVANDVEPVPKKPTQVRVVEPIAEVEDGFESDSSSASASTSSSSVVSSNSSSSVVSSSSSSSNPTSSGSSSSGSSISSPPRPVPSTKSRLSSSKTPVNSNIQHVPPGYGKPSTHSRNQRRRKKRLHEKEQPTASTIPKGVSDANAVPLGLAKPTEAPTPASAKTTARTMPQSDSPAPNTSGTREGAGTPTAPVYITQDQVMMGSLRNKNKKKGFKLSMANPIPQKIVFDAPSSAPPQPAAASASGSMGPPPHTPARVQSTGDIPKTTTTPSLFNSTPAASYVRLIPPSEIQAMHPERIPHNMIITSVDVEAGMWDLAGNEPWGGDAQAGGDGKKKKRGKKDKKQAAYQGDAQWGEDEAEWVEAEWVEAEWGMDDGLYTAPDGDAGPPKELDYGQPEYKQSADMFDWERAEARWETHSAVITAPEQLVKGALVGWKALSINPQTFSPEVLLNVVRIVQPPEDCASLPTVLIRPITRPGDTETALAFGLVKGEGEGDGEGEEYEVSWTDVADEGWRLLDV